ncbi:hypothetical protein [Bacillus sp. T3]|nr:hypothetical protein [Bacillus sp. T3]
MGQGIIMYYLPILLISSIVTGFITGKIGELTINEVRKKGVFTVGN